MRKIPKPVDKPLDVFILCIQGVRDKVLAHRFISLTTEIEAAANAYEAAATASKLCTLVEQNGVGGGVVTTKEMIGLYEGRMVPPKSRGRVVYDRLMASASNGICPLCGQRTVGTLDHYLPKTKFPAVAVNPLNLIPTCSDCNKAKDDEITATEEKQIFTRISTISETIAGSTLRSSRRRQPRCSSV
jgi:hypothetical protein